ncbi:MAG: GntP family permease [Deltaproteobacteria bacterium]|nr:GntP family permease [Deltaproteobacteria bacterium]MBW2390244.1 GntP family permease [Deltaproteobacteria bacterium]MBW2722798.1 GntP family permease [Deltaproteobacteria bacterium]
MTLLSLLAAAIVFIVIATTRLGLHPFLALLLAAIGFGLLAGMPAADVIAAVNAGFGGTIGSIGIVILAGSIIGTFLEKSGGALRLAERMISLSGERHVPAAMGVVGWLVSLPVFCDSGFVILSSLNRALARRAGITLATGAVALSLGLYATHTMVPPTPGPVAAAGILGADLGRVIGWGLLISAIALLGGWVFAVTVASRVQIDPGPEESQLDSATSEAAVAPSAGHALLPILVPIGLIVVRSIAALPEHPLGEGSPAALLDFIGHPVVALLIGVAIAFTLPRVGLSRLLGADGWVGEAIVAAGSIIVITGAGGAFGKVLQGSGIADVIGASLADAQLGVWLPFLIAAGIKTAQGSSTVAIITTAGLLAPLLPALGLDSETGRALAVVSIGAGAMVVSHANDSYFWVVTQFSSMDLRTGIRLQTLGTLVQGSVAACAVWLVSLFAL